MNLPDEIAKHKVSIGLAVGIALMIVFVMLEWDAINDHAKEADRRYEEFKQLKQTYYEQH